MPGAITRRAPRRSWSVTIPHVRLRLARVVRGISRVRALLDRGRQCLCRADRSPLYRRDRGPHSRRRLSRLVPGRAVYRRLVRGGPGQEPLRAHAGVGAGGGCHRHPGAVPYTRPEERDRLRHGRHHCQGGGHLQRRGAHDRCRVDRRLRQGSADATCDDGHIRGRNGRRLDRPGGGGRASCWPAKRGRRARVRPATAVGGSEPTVTDANLVLGRLGADRFLGGEMRLDVEEAALLRWRRGWRSPWACPPSRRRMEFCASR